MSDTRAEIEEIFLNNQITDSDAEDFEDIEYYDTKQIVEDITDLLEKKIREAKLNLLTDMLSFRDEYWKTNGIQAIQQKIEQLKDSKG